VTHRTRRGFDPSPTFADPLTDEQFEATERYLTALTNWAQDDADVRERFAASDAYARARGSWQRWMGR